MGDLVFHFRRLNFILLFYCYLITYALVLVELIFFNNYIYCESLSFIRCLMAALQSMIVILIFLDFYKFLELDFTN
jgi:hypothetical protein